MRSLRSLIGLPVIVRQKNAGRVLHAELTEDLSQLKGLWIDAGLRGTRFIPAESIGILGEATVQADNIGKRRSPTPAPLFRRAVGTEGSRLGAIVGAGINSISFQVESLELSGSLWEDLASGRAHITSFTLNRENGDVIIDTAAAEMEATEHEKRYGQGTDHRRGDRRFGCHDVRHHELAERTSHECKNEEDRTLDRQQGR